MFIVADSGSTKTHWTIIAKDKITESFQTQGLNPYFVNEEMITKEIVENFPQEINPQHIQTVYFYGAGCKVKQTRQVILNGCSVFFSQAQIIIETDLLGAARALFADQEGLVSILGTGANTGIYNGRHISRQIPSLGFALGDEGSGAHLGKLLVIDYLHQQLPDDLSTLFERNFSISRDEIIYSVYKKPTPSKFLANFAPFIHRHRGHPHIQQIIQRSFQSLFENYICKYPDYKKYALGFAGSIAHSFKAELEIKAHENGLSIVQIIKDPMKKLAEFHLEAEKKK
ncbi:MAG: ATPase [Bacteroidales bacterium]|jgi:N-acetylglucosamine kinase-like BadF-type ATPase|nr:ATPase [Bacteroidales bacterium]